MTTINAQPTEVTPEMATLWLNTTPFSRQRHVRSRQVTQYANLMTRGTWEPFTVLTFCTVDGADVLIDGQHRLMAVVKSNLPQMFLIVRRPVDSLDDAARVYTTIDKNIVRTLRDDFTALGLAEEFDIRSNEVNELGSAVALVASGFSRVRQANLHPDDRLDMMREYVEPLREYLATISGCDRIICRRMMRSATMGVAIVTFRYSADVYDNVSEFWSGVAQDDGLRSSDPRKFCVRHLQISGMTGGGASSARFARHNTPAYSARRIAAYFNAFVENKTLKQDVKILNESAPIKILGSPFKGR